MATDAPRKFGGGPHYFIGEFNGDCTVADSRREWPFLVVIVQELTLALSLRRSRSAGAPG